MRPKKIDKPAAKQTEYELTARERSAVEAFRAYQAANPAPPLKVSKTGEGIKIEPDHVDLAIGSTLLMEAIGSRDYHFYQGLLNQLTNAGSEGREADVRGINFMLSVVKGIAPRDQVEAMLAAQMAAVHIATMRFARRLANVENIPQQDSAERAFNMLARTFASRWRP